MEHSTWVVQTLSGGPYQNGDVTPRYGNLIIAGDGYAYVAYLYMKQNESAPSSNSLQEHDQAYLKVLRMNSDGGSQKFLIKQWSYDYSSNSIFAQEGIWQFGEVYSCLTPGQGCQLGLAPPAGNGFESADNL